MANLLVKLATLLLLLWPHSHGQSLRTDPFTNIIPKVDSDDYPLDNPSGKWCPDFHPGIDLPCQCSSSGDNGTWINCDGVVFPGDFPVLPFRYRIHGFTQRWAGYQSLPGQLFTASDVPLKKLDMSHNGVVRITDRLLDGLTDTMEEINFSHNLLGDQLNPIFSTLEFQNLPVLKKLDLSHNDIKALDDSIFKGSDRLQELRLEHNSFVRVPNGALKWPKTLQRLHLEHNDIGNIGNEVFVQQRVLHALNLSHNVITNMEPNALKGMEQLRTLDLSYNKISRLSERIFQDVSSLQELDLTNNFLSAFPSSVKGLTSLKRLSLSANLIQNVDSGTLGEMVNLEFLDLSRNNIAELPNGTLSRVGHLKSLQFSVNKLRKVEDDAFLGLDQLEELYLDDNNMLAVPQAALRHMKKLRRLSLSFNRIAVVSSQLFSSTPNLEHISLSHNVIREIPEGAFHMLKSLKKLELRGNQLTSVTTATFRGVSQFLQVLDVSSNRISDLEPLDLPQLQEFRLQYNNITDLKRGQFSKMTRLLSLNISHNSIDFIPSAIFKGLNQLRVIDLRSNNLATLAVGIFDGLTHLKAVYLQNNLIQQIDSRTFNQLPQLRVLQLSGNQINLISSNALENVPKLSKIILCRNKLESIPKSMIRISNSSINVQILDLSSNKITNLSSQDLFDWTKLEFVSISNNKLVQIDEKVFQNQRQVKIVDISRNKLRTLPKNLLASLPKLRVVDISYNVLENVSPGLFQNSTQIQYINMGFNRLRTLPDILFNGLARLNLNLEHNRFNSLTGTLFERSKVHRLHSINLAYNFFEEVPAEALQKQYFFLDNVNLAHNRIHDIPADGNLLVTVKTLDLSYNPLSEDTIQNILSEPKTVKDLNMAGTGVAQVPILETPFLRRLNLSSNKIESLSESIFQRPTLLEVLDLSGNQLPNISSGLAGVWPRMTNLKTLILSNNPLNSIVQGDLSNLTSLEVLHLTNLIACTRIDSQAFNQLPSLREFRLYGLPRLESLHSRAILQNMVTLEHVEIEITEPSLQDQLAPAFLPRIRQVHVHGRGGLRAISPATLAGITSPDLLFVFHDTAISNLPTSLLFPVPMSTHLVLNLSGAKIPVLSPQFLAAADNHGKYLELRGLNENPIVCDCNARPFRRWLKAHIPVRGTRTFRRTPRQIQADESSSILVRVSASTALGRSVRANATRSSDGAQSNDLVAFKFANSVSNLTLNSSFQRPPPDVITIQEASAQVPLTTPEPEGQVFVVTTGYEEGNEEEDTRDDSDDLSKELSQVRCSGPPSLLGLRLIDIAEEELGCDGLGRGEVVTPNENENPAKDTIDVVVAARPSRPFTPVFSPTSSNTEEEPEIIWYNENDVGKEQGRTSTKDSRRFPDKKAGKPEGTRAEGSTSAGLNNMDALIIGIVGGVVAFVAILIIIICLVRLKSASTPYRGGPLAATLRHDKCTCLSPGGGHPVLCHCLPGYPGHALHGPPSLPPLPGLPALPSLPLPAPPSNRTGTLNSIYSAPLPRKICPPPHPSRSALGVSSRSSYYPPTPYYVTFPPDSETELVHR